MVSSTIQIYGRIRPIKKNSKFKASAGRYWVEQNENMEKVGFHVPKDIQQGLVNHQKENYEFQFNKVFDTEAGQEEIFDAVAKPIIDSTLQGYNGTLFAYGQTGSGKTFTITGGAERYADRGLIPRTLQYIFKHIQNDPQSTYSVHVSYLEIYNEIGYDLLDSSRDAKKLEDLPKVSLMEDEFEMIHLKNLSVVPAGNEEDALNLLFVGDTNRMIAETPSNPSSSRSHCIFIITLTCRKAGQDVIRRSKLHLVDLAGSERVARTGIDGNLLKEAKHINLSLHYLEQVIVALHESSKGKRTHIPYRNSMMTSVLRDSIGGNCKTTMIATVAVEDLLIEESISTCRFAQRVALIANNATLNEELDPQLTISRLKAEIARLKAELAIARGETADNSEELPDYEKDRIRTAVDEYLQDISETAELVFSDYKKIQYAFKLVKTRILNGGGITNTSKSSLSSDSIDFDEQGLSANQLQQFNKLKQLAMHRDNEINILVGMIAQLKQAPVEQVPCISYQKIERVPSLQRASITTTVSENNDLKKPLPQLSTEKAKAFEIFKQSYPSSDWIERQKQILKSKYMQAKQLGAKAGTLRNEMKTIKERLADLDNTPDLEAQRLRLSNLILEYKSAYQSLKDLKAEIEHLQHLLEQGRIRMTRDFEAWYVEVYQMDNETIAKYRDDPIVKQELNEMGESAQSEFGTHTAQFKSEAWVNPTNNAPVYELSRPEPRPDRFNQHTGNLTKPKFEKLASNLSSRTLTDEYADTNVVASYQRLQSSRSLSRLGLHEQPRPLSSQSSFTPVDRKSRPPSRLDPLSNDAVSEDIQAFYKVRDQLLAKNKTNTNVT
ncbi:Kinesin- protein 6 [Terramyces sp. JEL0728]|nr:Kinesin- protein 6 [Terramyces sp. JEL0728]